jgi:hypothetical protein
VALEYANGSSQSDQAPQSRIAELQLENSRLRRLVTDAPASTTQSTPPIKLTAVRTSVTPRSKIARSMMRS